MNEGDDFTGTDLMDRALADRFISVKIDPLKGSQLTKVLEKKDKVEKDTAERIAALSDTLRDRHEIHVSYRSAVNLARLLERGVHPVTAVTAAIPAPEDFEENLRMEASTVFETTDTPDRSVTEFFLTDQQQPPREAVQRLTQKSIDKAGARGR